jgi:hypothetical protein
MTMQKRRIPARDVVDDIHAGLSNSALKRKYDLSDHLLSRLFDKLYSARLISPSEHEKRVAALAKAVGNDQAVSYETRGHGTYGTGISGIRKRYELRSRKRPSGVRHFIMGAGASLTAMAVIFGILWQVGPLNSSVGFIIPGGEEVNQPDKNGVTFLMKACLQGNVERVKNLISQGADVNALDKDSETALMAAAYNGHERIVQILLEHGAIVGVRNNHGITAMEIARSRGHVAVERLLVAHMKGNR